MRRMLEKCWALMATKRRPHSRRHANTKRGLRFEALEERRLLSINWTNPNAADNGFNVYGPNAALASQIVSRAIADWDRVLMDQNYDNDNNPATNGVFNLTINATDLLGGRGRTLITALSTNVGHPTWDVGVPTAATVTLDDDGGSGIVNDQLGPGDGWFFDKTPLDDAEFTGIVNSGSTGTGSAFQASFIDIATGTQNYNDFYRTILHEIGHAVGIAFSSSTGQLTQITSFLTYAGTDQVQSVSNGITNDLWRFNNPTGPFGVTATITEAGGAHLYEGPVDPLYPTVPIHPNELMNAGRTVPAGQPSLTPPLETTRQFISDLNIQVLADAYGYSVVLPSTINTAHATLDYQTGTLLVQGRTGGQIDTIAVTINGSNIQVAVNNTIELVPTNVVRQVVIARNGGADPVNVTGIPWPVSYVDYVVSSNQDSASAGTVGDSIVDLDTVVPGNQVALRAAIIDANGTAGGAARAIYVPRGNYGLTRQSVGTDTATDGDLEILGNVTIIGTGPGETIIDATPLQATNSDRVFDINSGGILSLYSLTVTGGLAPTLPNAAETHGGGILVRNGGTLYTGGVAIVGNKTSDSATDAGNGGGIYFANNAGAAIQNTVITSNNARNYTGGIFLAAGSPAAGVYIGNTIVALNTSTNFPTSAGPDVLAQAPSRSFTSLGGNRTGNTTNGLPGTGTDYVGTTNYVVTGIADTYNTSNDGKVFSVREAVHATNDSGTAQEIWLPAWGFILTLERGNIYTDLMHSATDTSATFGDLDVDDSLTIRGVGGMTTVAWRAGAAADAVFDLLGDYNGDGITSADNGSTDSADYSTWRYYFLQQHLTDRRADGNDNGVIDQGDYDVWIANFGNTFTLWGVS